MSDDPNNIRGRLIMARATRGNALANRDRSVLNIELAERALINAEGKLVDADQAVNALLDELLLERAAERKQQAEKLVTS
jgi:hypothetical protein